MDVIRFLNVFLAGIGAGCLLTNWVVIAPAEHHLPDREGAQNHVETSKFIDYFMPPSMIISVLAAFVAVIAEGDLSSVSKTWLAIGLACSIAVGLISVAVNLPIDAKIAAAWKQDNLGALPELFKRWTRVHGVRAVCGVLAFACYLISLIVR
jgi:uncharacterized membrane protein